MTDVLFYFSIADALLDLTGTTARLFIPGASLGLTGRTDVLFHLLIPGALLDLTG